MWYDDDPPVNEDDVFRDCPECDGQATWCSFCKEWTQTCCKNDGYGSCLCS